MSEQHPIGIFPAVVTEHFLGDTKGDGTGSWYLAITFQTEHGEIGGQLWLTDKAIQKTTERLRRVFGYTIEDDSDVSMLHDGNALVGKPAKIDVQDETGNDGTVRRVVRWINHPNETGGGRRRANATLVVAFAKRWAAIAKATGGTVVTLAPTDNDIPF